MGTYNDTPEPATHRCGASCTPLRSEPEAAEYFGTFLAEEATYGIAAACDRIAGSMWSRGAAWERPDGFDLATQVVLTLARRAGKRWAAHTAGEDASPISRCGPGLIVTQAPYTMRDDWIRPALRQGRVQRRAHNAAVHAHDRSLQDTADATAVHDASELFATYFALVKLPVLRVVLGATEGRRRALARHYGWLPELPRDDRKARANDRQALSRLRGDVAAAIIEALRGTELPPELERIVALGPDLTSMEGGRDLAPQLADVVDPLFARLRSSRAVRPDDLLGPP